MSEAIRKVNTPEQLSITELRRLLLRAVSVLIASPQIDADILHYIVELPIKTFSPLAIAAGVDAWTWLVRQRPVAESALMGKISAGWLSTIKAGKGLFSTSMNYHDPFVRPIEYAPSDKAVMDVEMARAKRLLLPHLLLVQILSSQFQAVKYRVNGIMVSLARLMIRSLAAYKKMSTHPLAREVRFSLLLFGFQVLASSRMEAVLELRFRDALYTAAFAWFAGRPQWSFGSDRIQVGAEIKLLQDFITAVSDDHIRGDHSTTSMHDRAAAWIVPGSTSLQDYISNHRQRVRLLQLLVESEINRLLVWSNPSNVRDRVFTQPGSLESQVSNEEWSKLVRTAWKIQPGVAVHMGERFKNANLSAEIGRLVRASPKSVLDVPEALCFFLGDKFDPSISPVLKWLLLWDPVPPVEALDYFQPRYDNNPVILQYAMRVLEQHPVDLVFFFVPQVVQALRYDALGYVERFIFETSKISQLFCHQIIWNMKANTYKDDNGEEPDGMKPQLDRMVHMIVASLSGKAAEFYEREFGFFADVTSISGKLKPYIKKTKPEKKAKIDEEMAKIKLEVGVYLPSNPDGVVVDLDRKSGRPLQSHAKAPFMATFKVRKERIEVNADESVEATDGDAAVTTYDVWQSAIFKVGDDCRQDVLALQLIAMFKNIFTTLGLTLYLYPYRVTATAPGCGVIDVVPNATSRDEMGRAQINDLVEYFVDKYGGLDTVTFQKARLNFIQSMAAYSVACYILQIKDRHNGNIMIDGEGHIVHIDFGFLFDIGPGGIKFEAGSFKLNKEMVALMGGSDSQGYKMFTDLAVKAFLAIRPHATQLVDTVALMLGTGLPSFKGEGTIRRLRDRFQLQLPERQAAEYMMGVIKNAHENMRSDIYDGFQKYQNGIPYK
jgi:phosphatidylinositol 4-kinase